MIVESGNHYCIGLKGNQPTLLCQGQQCGLRHEPVSEHFEEEHSHGREIERWVRVYAAPVELRETWRELAAFVKVERRGVRDGEEFERVGWFIASQVAHATQMAEMIRGHRGAVENRLHWVKDVVQGEDGSLLREAGMATLIATLRSWATTVYRRAGHISITRAVRQFGHNLKALLRLL